MSAVRAIDPFGLVEMQATFSGPQFSLQYPALTPAPVRTIQDPGAEVGNDDPTVRPSALFEIERVLDRERDMRIGQLAALAIGIGVLTGCATRLGALFVEPTPCPDPICQVSVNVTHTSNPFKLCSIDVQPQKLKVGVGPQEVQTIRWTVSGLGSWPPVSGPLPPIKFDSNAESVMSLPELSGNSVSVKYTRPRTLGHTYGYDVNVLTELQKICSLDPWVVD